MRLPSALFIILTLPAFAADLPKKSTAVPVASGASIPTWTFCKKPATLAAASDVKDVPGGDIFGFTNGTDVGNLGDCSTAFEYSARTGKLDGKYYSGTLKIQNAFSVAENFQLNLSPFITHHSVSGVTGLNDASKTNFDGASAEFIYRLLSRSKTNPFALSLSAETRYARVDSLSGDRVNAQGLELKIFTDIVLSPDKWFAAMNLNWAFGTQKGLLPTDVTQQNSGTNTSFALTYQASDTLYLGTELRHLRAYNGFTLNTFQGYATFFGPSMLYKLNDTTSLNVVWTPQIAGHSSANAGHLDLDNFEKHQFRLKLAKSF